MVPTNNLRTPPEGVPWINAFSDDQFTEAYLEVKDKFVQSPEAAALTEDCGANDFDWKEFTYGVEEHFDWHGKPVHSLIYFYLNFSAGFVPYKRDINKVYRALTGKSVNTKSMCLVAWYLHFDPPVNAPRGGKKIVPSPPPVPIEPGTEKGVEVRDLSGQPIGVRSPDRAPGRDLVASLDSNTQAILEVMEDFADFKKQFQKWKSLRGSQADTTESKLDEAIKAGFDPRTNLKLAQMEKRIGGLMRTEVQNFKHEVNRTLEPRIKALESGIIMAPEGEAKWEERFAQMKEDLRAVSVVADAALVAERQASDDVSPNPFASLDQVKAALKAAGFKGTLTLTIE